MPKIYYCPECKNELEELSGCGVVGYFCNSCKKLISRKKMLTEEELQKVLAEEAETEKEE